LTFNQVWQAQVNFQSRSPSLSQWNLMYPW